MTECDAHMCADSKIYLLRVDFLLSYWEFLLYLQVHYFYSKLASPPFYSCALQASLPGSFKAILCAGVTSDSQQVNLFTWLARLPAEPSPGPFFTDFAVCALTDKAIIVDILRWCCLFGWIFLWIWFLWLFFETGYHSLGYLGSHVFHSGHKLSTSFSFRIKARTTRLGLYLLFFCFRYFVWPILQTFM